MTQIPDTLAALLEPSMLAELDEKLGPPAAARIAQPFEVELEIEGEGTFTVAYKDTKLTGKKGFAKGDPIVSARVPKAGVKLLQALVQAAVDGFPQSPPLQKGLSVVTGLQKPTLTELFKNVERTKPVSVVFDVKGHGSFAVARGALDEATRTLKVSIDGGEVLALLRGGPLTAVRAQVTGDRTLAAEIAAVLAPVLTSLKRA